MVSKLDFYVAVLLLCLTLGGSIILHGYLSSKKSDAAAIQQLMKDWDAQHKQNQQTIVQADKAENQNQKDLAAKVTIIREQQQQPITPVDYDRIDTMIQQHIGAPAKTTTDPTVDAPSTTLQTKPLRDYMLSCDEKSARLDSCALTTSNQEQKIQALQSDNEGLNKVVDAQKKVLKGGSFWHKVGVGLKHSSCGAAAVGAGMFASRYSTQTGAISGGAVWAGCEVLLNR